MKRLRIIASSRSAQMIALLLLRWAAGVVFLFHGYPKLAHAQEWTRAFAHMGFPPYFAYIAGFLETVGGALLILGLATRVSAALLTAEMAIAFLKVDFFAGPVSQVDNYQVSLLLAAGSLILASFGAGVASVDHVISAARAKNAASLPRRGRMAGIS